MNTITINIDNDNRPIIENGALFDKSLMTAQYRLAFDAIESVLNAQEHLPSTITIKNNIEYPNNIVVFDGERGSGKTSSMLSVAKMLIEEGVEPYKNLKKLTDTHFVMLSMLEPSFFDNEHNVLDLFVSQLYKEFSELKEVNPNQKKEILALFVDVQNQLTCMLGKKGKQDALEYLVNLSAAMDLRVKLRNLVRKYLEIVGDGKTKLLILIDDIDLNQSQADRMVEEIRKYLILDNCIILVSIKFEQLYGILYRIYEKEYSIKDDAVKIEIRDRVDRYLNKLFPQRQRIFMPQPEVYLKYILKVETERSFDYKLEDNGTVEESIPDLIFAKTRYLFYNTRKSPSLIVPRNLRSIRQILKLLMEMKNYKDGDSQSLVNKEVFKHYFYKEWIEQNIHPRDKDFVEELINRDSMESLNYFVLDKLNEFVFLNETEKNSKEINDILDKRNHYYNISLGDVLSVIRTVENQKFDIATKKLLFFIKAFYGIKLYEAYDTITPDMKPEEMQPKYYICRKEKGVVTDDYQALLSGSVFNESTVNSKLGDLQMHKSAFSNLITAIDEEVEPENQVKLYHLIEFLMLYVSYRQSADTAVSQRRYDNKYYSEFEIDSDEAFIGNIGAFIYNLSRYKEAIDRFRNIDFLTPFFTFFDNPDNETLLAHLKKYAQEERKGNVKKSPMSKLLSVCCFRNMEVLEDFCETISPKLQNQMTPVEAILQFMKVAEDYSIFTYDRYEEGGQKHPYKISFGYISIFKDLLADQYVIEKLNSALKELPHEENKERDTQAGSSEDMPSATVPSSKS